MSYHILTPGILRKFYPLNDFEDELVDLVMRKVEVENIYKGNVIFNQGDNDSDVIYLISGSIELKSDEGAHFILDPESELAKFPIANSKPRKFSALIHTDSAAIARIPSATIESLVFDLDKDKFWNSAAYVTEGETHALDAEWMMAMKRTPLFQKLQDQYLNQLFQVMDEESFKEGEDVITEGESGDYFYLVKEGTCKVLRQKDGKEIELAKLRATDSFGEDALLSDNPRNATVRMVTDGTLMRISKKDFQHFMFLPIVKWVEADQVKKLLSKGARLIDVRKNRDGKVSPKDAKYIPLFMLRNQLKRLDRDQKYLILCDDDHDGAIASYLFGKYGMDGYLLHTDHTPE